MSTTPSAVPAATNAPSSTNTPAATPDAAPKTNAAPVNRDSTGKFTGHVAQPAVKRDGDATEAPPKAPETAAATEARRKYKLKVDGQEREEELSDDEVAIRLQKGLAADKRMSEAAEIRKAYAQLREIARTAPEQLLKELAGLDPDEWAEQRLAERVKREMMPEHERKILEAQQEVARERKAREELEARLQADAQAKADAEAAAALEAEYQQTFQRLDLDWSPENVELVGKIMLDALDEDIQLTPAQVAAEAKRVLAKREADADGRFRSRVSSLDGQELLDFLGPDVVKKALRASVAQYKKTPSQATTTAPAQTPTPERPKERKITTEKEWRQSFAHTRVGRPTRG